MSNPGVSYVIFVLISPPNEVPRCETRQRLPRLQALTAARCPPASSPAAEGADSRMSIGATASDLASERTSDQFNLFLSCSAHPNLAYQPGIPSGPDAELPLLALLLETLLASRDGTE